MVTSRLGAALALFVSFAGISLLRAAAGLESCGCFGAIRVNPWITLAIDPTIIASLYAGRGRFFDHPRSSRRSSRRWLAACLVMIVSSLVVLFAFRPERLTASTALLGEGSLVILEPTQWLGEPFPLDAYLDPAFDLSTGRWIVVLYHHDCPKCQEALPKYERIAGDADARQLDGVLAVEIPPFGPKRSQSDSTHKHARLSETGEWFVQTPVEIELCEGVVVRASLDLPNLEGDRN